MAESDYSIRVSLKITGDAVVPDEVTANTGVVPDKAFVKGDPNPRGEQFQPYQHNGWVMRSGADKTANLNVHLDSILVRLIPHEEYIRTLNQDDSVTVAFTITMLDVYKFALWDDTLAKITRLGAEMYFTVL